MFWFRKKRVFLDESSLFQLSIKGSTSSLSRLEEAGFEMRVVLSFIADVWKRVIRTANVLNINTASLK